MKEKKQIRSWINEELNEATDTILAFDPTKDFALEFKVEDCHRQQRRIPILEHLDRVVFEQDTIEGLHKALEVFAKQMATAALGTKPESGAAGSIMASMVFASVAREFWNYANNNAALIKADHDL